VGSNSSSPSRRTVANRSQIVLVEKTPFKTTYMTWRKRWPWVPMRPETKNACAGEGQKQFNRPISRRVRNEWVSGPEWSHSVERKWPAVARTLLQSMRRLHLKTCKSLERTKIWPWVSKGAQHYCAGEDQQQFTGLDYYKEEKDTIESAIKWNETRQVRTESRLDSARIDYRIGLLCEALVSCRNWA
jgi:hypothetical protein